MNTFTNKYLGQNVNIAKENNQVWFVAKDIFEVLTLSWRGADSLWQRQIPKEWTLKQSFLTRGGSQKTWFINKLAIKKMILGSNKQSEEIIKVAQSFDIEVESTFLRTEVEIIKVLKAVLLGFDKKAGIKTQYRVKNYRLDGYIEKYNIVLEYQEKYHKRQMKTDLKRKEDIKKYLTSPLRDQFKEPKFFIIEQFDELKAITSFTNFMIENMN